jgi:hypothetical protein
MWLAPLMGACFTFIAIANLLRWRDSDFDKHEQSGHSSDLEYVGIAA